jgi:hypothetical protein
MLEAVGELSRRRHGEDPYGGTDVHRRICGEISLELTVPTGQAEELLAMAETLPVSLPRTWAAMRTGQIDCDRARVMADGITGLDESLAHRLDADLIDDAVDDTKTLLRRRLTGRSRKPTPPPRPNAPSRPRTSSGSNCGKTATRPATWSAATCPPPTRTPSATASPPQRTP